MRHWHTLLDIGRALRLLPAVGGNTGVKVAESIAPAAVALSAFSADPSNPNVGLILSGAGTGGVSIASALLKTGVISPSSLSASQDDWDPPGLAGASVINITASTNVSITGLAGGVTGREVTLVNSSAVTVTLPHFSGSSTGGNKFFFATNASHELKRGAYIVLRHSTYWQAVTPVLSANGVPGVVKLDNTATNVLTGAGTMVAGEFAANKDAASGYAGLTAGGDLKFAQIPLTRYVVTLSGGAGALITSDYVDLTACSIWWNRLSWGSAPGHILVTYRDAGEIDFESSDGSDDGDIEVNVLGVLA